MNLTLKKSIIATLWFGISGIVAVVFGYGITLLLTGRIKNFNHSLSISLAISTIIIIFILAACFGRKVIDCAALPNNGRKAIWYGFIGGVLALLVADFYIILYFSYDTFQNCSKITSPISCRDAFQSWGWEALVAIPISFFLGGWFGILVAMLSAYLLYRFARRYKFDKYE
jgi:hypothetical protein